VRERLASCGVPGMEDDAWTEEGVARIFANDPFGNQLKNGKPKLQINIQHEIGK